MNAIRLIASFTCAMGLGAASASAQDAPLGLTAAAEVSPATLLRLRDGSIRWGEITEHDPDGLGFRLLSHGGEVRLAWEYLDPAQEAELRLEYGYVDVSSEELMIEAERLVLTDGREVIGVILSREGPNFLVKVDGNMQAVPKRRVASLTSGQLVPALDIYSRDELYGQYLATLDETDPASQLELAELCERILDYKSATTHYQAALDLGAGEAEEAAKFSLDRAQEKAKQQEQIDYLRASDIQRKRGNYDLALQQLSAFATSFPGSPLIQDAAEKLARTEQLRDDAARKLVQRRWTYWAKRLSRAAAGELAFDAAESFATGRLSEEVQKRVHEDVQKNISQAIPLEAIPEYWATRRLARYSTASYGQATWLLGKDRARAGTADEAEEKRDQESALDKERAAFEEKMKRFLQNQQRAARARGGADDGEDSAAYWATMSGNARASWIFAYYVEFGGVYELGDRPHTPNCTGCGGTGGREVVSVGGGASEGGGGGRGGGRGGRQSNTSGLRIVECPACHGAAVTRRLYFR